MQITIYGLKRLLVNIFNNNNNNNNTINILYLQLQMCNDTCTASSANRN